MTFWKMFDLPTQPLSPRREVDDDLSLENMSMPFDIDEWHEYIMYLYDKSVAEAMMSLTAETCPESSPDEGLQSFLIQDIMWPAGSKPEDIHAKVIPKEKVDKRMRCDSCSGRPFNPQCVAPKEVFPYLDTNISGFISETRVNGLGTETPSETEKEINVVNNVAVEKHCREAVPAITYSRVDVIRSDSDSKPDREKKRSLLRQKIDCPTDVHNYSRSVRSRKRVLERKRRTDLKNSFSHLKNSVPELEGQEGAPKLVILRHASQYIQKLNEECKKYKREKGQLKIKKERLRRQLARLSDL